MEYNIYCDESCHLEHDNNDIFVVGGMKCPQTEVKRINSEVLALKEYFGYSKKSEIKWTKISNGNLDFYLALVELFFKDAALSFRGYIGRGKTELDNPGHSQSFDDWYYKMYYRMLEFVLNKNSNDNFNIYLDIKDTLGSKKITIIQGYLNSHFDRSIVNHIQLVRSDEVAILQLADLFIGALSYKHRGLSGSESKLTIIKKIEELSRQNLLLTSSYKQSKANWFVWTPDTWR